jgi:hypothetical protein
MKGVFVHDETGKLKSFGIVADTPRVRAGMRPIDGAVLITANVNVGDVEKFHSARGHISANLAVSGTSKDASLKHRTSR